MSWQQYINKMVVHNISKVLTTWILMLILMYIINIKNIVHQSSCDTVPPFLLQGFGSNRAFNAMERMAMEMEPPARPCLGRSGTDPRTHHRMPVQMIFYQVLPNIHVHIYIYKYIYIYIIYIFIYIYIYVCIDVQWQYILLTYICLNISHFLRHQKYLHGIYKPVKS